MSLDMGRFRNLVQSYSTGKGYTAKRVSSLTIQSSEVAEASSLLWNDEATNSWVGMRQADYVSRVTNGAPAFEVKEATNLIEQYLFDLKLPETMGRIRERSVFGATISVPEYLSGSPTCFRRRKHREHDIAPIRLYISLSASASFRSNMLRDRALGMFALAQAIQRFRPVTVVLYAAAYEGDHIALFQIEVGTTPLDLSTVVALVGTSATMRGLSIPYRQAMFGFYSGLPNQFEIADLHTYLRTTAEDIVTGPLIHPEEPVAYASRILRESGLIPAD